MGDAQKIEKELRTTGHIAVALRRPRSPETPDVGLTIGLRFRKGKFIARVEIFKVDSGYGQSLSEAETSFDTFDELVAFVAREGFSIDQFRF